MEQLGRELDAAGAAPSASTPSIMPPPGVQAQVESKIRYPITVDSRGGYGRDLEDLAASEAGNLPPLNDDLPSDPLLDFLEEWNQYANGQYQCLVYRLPDSGPKRIPGSMYNRPYFGPAPENLGTMIFDANVSTFISDLQMLNQNSGGSFQVHLINMQGRRVPDAILYSCTVADPYDPQKARQQPQAQAQPQYLQARPVEKSDAEKRMERMTEQLLETAIQRALNPAAPVATQGSALNAEDQALLYVFKNTDVLGTVIAKVKEASAAADPVPADSTTWKDRGIEALVGLAQTNPAIVDRVSGVLERVVTRIFPDPVPAPAYYPQPYAQQPTPQQLQPAPQPPPQPQPASEQPSIVEKDMEIMDILQEFITLLNSSKQLEKNDPVFKKLQRKYPLKFRAIVRLIAASPLDSIIDWVKLQDPIYKSMLESDVSGPFLHNRIGELQIVFQDAIKGAEAAKQPPPAPAPAPAPTQEIVDPSEVLAQNPGEAEEE
jgi:hypothetical protein